MAKYTLIQNARVLREGGTRIEDADLLLQTAEDGKSAVIVAIERRIPRQSLDGTLSVINVRGNLVTPCFKDLSVSLREPGNMYKESIAATVNAARHGGYDTLLSFFESHTDYTPRDVLEYWHAYPQDPDVRLAFTAPAFSADGTLSPIEELLSYSDTVLTNRFATSDNRAILLDAMRACADAGKTFVLYPRVSSLARNGAVNAHIASGMKANGILPVAESLAVAEGIMLAEEAGCSLHIAALSLEKSVSLVREAKKHGLPVTADTSPAYFYFSEAELYYNGARAKLFPPLREERDRMAVLEGISDGTIDAIASHHVPNATRDYQNTTLQSAPFGAVGLELTLPATVEALLAHGMITTVRLVELLSLAPRRILSGMGIETAKGHFLQVGDTPNFNVLSLDATVKISESSFHGRATNTPFMDTYLQGAVERTFRRGLEVKL